VRRALLALAALALAACSLVDVVPVASPSVTPSGMTITGVCTATPPSEPANYKAGTPVRTKTGTGYVFSGTVRATSCAPIAGASVEIWHANPSGVYDDDHRATLIAGSDGRYRLETSFPAAYGGGVSHIHIRVTAPGHRTLVAFFEVAAGSTSGEMDLVLEPA
jgi:protocatechuate 3,4-dioxygenase beta subunit